MKKKTWVRIFTAMVACGALLLCSGRTQPVALEEEPGPAKRSSREIIEEMVICYGYSGDKAEKRIAELLQELNDVDRDTASRWERILEIWKSCGADLEVNYGVVPDGLPETDELCFVVLGFQLYPDGAMKDELIQRLMTLLNCAEKYPNALIVCTGGGTAAQNPDATEAGKMAEWLIGHGVAPERIIVEDKSQSTAQNAMFTYDILTKDYPQVTQLAIVSSDYHIPTGTLLFRAEAVLRAEQPGGERFSVVSNASCHPGYGLLNAAFQAGALIELAGDLDKANEIYYGTYTIYKLPGVDD